MTYEEAKQNLEGSESVNDNVNHPDHYNAGGIECIDALEAATGKEGFEGFCTANAIKYLWRWKHKNGVEDLRKAKWYIERLIRKIEGQAAPDPDQPETCLQRLKREHPDCAAPHFAGGAYGCPSSYGYAGSPQWCQGFGDKKLCAACWNRPAK